MDREFEYRQKTISVESEVEIVGKSVEESITEWIVSNLGRGNAAATVCPGEFYLGLLEDYALEEFVEKEQVPSNLRAFNYRFFDKSVDYDDDGDGWIVNSEGYTYPVGRILFLPDESISSTEVEFLYQTTCAREIYPN